MVRKKRHSYSEFLFLSLAALGVVFGDIGTSPLYALRLALSHTPLTQLNILGALSLIFWSLVLVISVKYLIFVLQADNRGEGGTIALLSLLKPSQYTPKAYFLLFAIGVLGASLLFSDGMITPAISVLSAVEGVVVEFPHLHGLIVPLAFVILLLLYLFQVKGSQYLGLLFGPIMLLWFIMLAVFGVLGIMQAPIVLTAINPKYALLLFYHYHFHTLLVVSGVFLAVTGGEALYADIGHFGKNTIRLDWFAFIFPALFLNYFGQGADLIVYPYHLKSPFYLLAPHWARVFLLIMATLATVIASQAVISAIFSLAKQAMSMRLLPRMRIVFTSSAMQGQVYVPTVNLIMALGTLGLVIFFKTSDNLANAYGIAVNLVMICVSILVTVLFYKKWRHGFFLAILFAAFMLSLDGFFLMANSLKVLHKGWLPIVFAGMVTILMIVWRRGIGLLHHASANRQVVFERIAQQLAAEKIVKVPGIAVFVHDSSEEVKSCFANQVKFNKVVHQTTVLLDIVIKDKPIVSIAERVQLIKQFDGLYHIKIIYGFKQVIDVPNTLRVCQKLGLLPFRARTREFTYFLEIANAQVSYRYNVHVPRWQKHLFVLLLGRFTQNIEFYRLPVHQTVMIGGYYEI